MSCLIVLIYTYIRIQFESNIPECSVSSRFVELVMPGQLQYVIPRCGEQDTISVTHVKYKALLRLRGT